MKDRLPCAWTNIKDGAVSLLDFALPGNLSGREMAAADNLGIFPLSFLQSSKMLLRNHENVRGSLRVDVFKSKDVIVLVDFSGGDFAAKNAAEQTIGPGIIH